MTTTLSRPTATGIDPTKAGSAAKKKRSALARSGMALAAVVATLGGVVAYSYASTMADIAAHEDRVVAVAESAGPVVYDTGAEVPEPVARWIEATFDDPSAIEPMTVSFGFEGDFRRPLTEGFNSVSGSQIVAANEPALVFSATTTMVPGLFAVAYDAYVEGEMEMKAKIESTITVVNERETPELNRTSLQRWLLMSPLYPTSLLPGGQVTWEAVDDDHARATIAAHGEEASLLFTFGADGRITSVDAETDGDLTTSYHGSGEHFGVSDYRSIDGVQIPHTFQVARAAGGITYPFLEASLTDYQLD